MEWIMELASESSDDSVAKRGPMTPGDADCCDFFALVFVRLTLVV
jgi:hypothetical protein